MTNYFKICGLLPGDKALGKVKHCFPFEKEAGTAYRKAQQLAEDFDFPTRICVYRSIARFPDVPEIGWTEAESAGDAVEASE